MQSWSVIVFCYNEKGTIINVLYNLEKVLNVIANNDWEVLIVDDGSDDGSTELINKYIIGKSNCKLIIHELNMGIGSAIKSGLQFVKNENISIVPADGQFNTDELVIFKSIPEKTIYSLYRTNKYQSIKRNLLTYFNRTIIGLLFHYNIKDINWIIIFKNSELKKLKLKLKSSLIMSELVIKMLINGCSLKEYPSYYYNRSYGYSKGGSFKIVKKALMEVVLLIFEIFRFKNNN